MPWIRGWPRKGQKAEGLEAASVRERTLLAESRLPLEVRDYLEAVMDKSHMHGDARVDVLEELVAHFQDGLTAGKTAGDLLRDFGDGEMMGDLIRRTRPKNRWTPRQSGTLRNRSGTFGMGLSTGFRHAIRGIRRNPGFASVAILTLALGIGLSTVMFNLVHSVLIKPLAYPDADRLVTVFRLKPELTGMSPSLSSLAGLYAVPLSLFQDWKELSTSFETSGAFATYTFTHQDGDQRARIRGAVVTSGVLRALGVQPVLGRWFLPEDDEPGAPAQVILSHGLWTGLFGGDAGVLGSQMILNEIPHTVVGVMPPRFRYPEENTSIWVTFEEGRKKDLVRQAGNLQVIARLRTGASPRLAQDEMDALARGLGEQHPEEADHGILVVPLKDLLVVNAKAGLWLLFGAVGLVLLIACANIANLLLVRGSERQRELAIHQALGASGGRLAFQHLGETTLLAIIGGVLGWGLAMGSQSFFLRLYPGQLPRAAEVGVDYGVFFIAAGFTALTGLLAGALPALKAARASIKDSLSEGERSSAGGRRGSRLLAVVAVSEVSLAFVLLAGAGLFIQSLVGLLTVDPGFSPANKLTIGFSLPSEARETHAAVGLFRELTERLEAIHGVEEVGHGTHVPLLGWISRPPSSFETSDGEVRGNHMANSVSPTYFSTMGIPVHQGRPFNPDDREGALPVAIVSAGMAELYWPGDSPIGRRVRLDLASDSVWRTVVGVAGDVRNLLEADPFPQYYLPFAQAPGPNAWYQAVVVSYDPGTVGIASQVRDALREVNPNINSPVRFLEEGIASAGTVRRARFLVTVLGILAGLAAVLAVLGVYGVLAFAVQQRSHEFGIRLALGAERGRMRREVVRRGLMMGGVGLALGGLIALVSGKVIESLLFEVDPGDPRVLSAIGILVILSILAASYFPARRATAVDPVEVLKGD